MNTKHWWRNLPESGSTEPVDRIEVAMRRLEKMELNARRLRKAIQELNEDIAVQALAHWTVEEVRVAIETTQLPGYLCDTPIAVLERGT